MEQKKINSKGLSKVKLLIWVALAILLGCGAFFAWSWGKIEFHVQRLGAQDENLALSSELALLEQGTPGREALYDFLLDKLDIKLPPLSFQEAIEPVSDKIIAVSRSGEVRTAGPPGPVEVAVVLADSSAPVEKVCTPLAEAAQAGTIRMMAGVLLPGGSLGALEIDLVFTGPQQNVTHMIMRIDKENADLEGTQVASTVEIQSALKGKTADSIRLMPRPGVRYARLIRFAYHLHAAGVRPVLVFGSPEAFGFPSPAELEELSRSLGAPSEPEQTRAAVRLKTAFSDLFPYDTSKPPAQNRTAIGNWVSWLEKNRNYVYFDAVTGNYVFDAAASAAGIAHKEYWLRKLRIVSPKQESSIERKEENH